MALNNVFEKSGTLHFLDLFPDLIFQLGGEFRIVGQ